jgi:phage I-like protein
MGNVQNNPQGNTQPTNQDLKNRLCEVLGLPENASDEKVLSAVSDLARKAQQADSLRVKLLQILKANLETSTEELLNLIQTRMTEKESLEVRLKALEDEIQRMKAEEAVEKALSEGKITPAMREWAVQLALKDPQAFEDFVKLQVPLSARLTGRFSNPEDEIEEGRRIAEAVKG